MKKLRFTGESPPLRLWRQYPIWEYCLGEEGVPGQDETTIRPSKAKYWIPRRGFDIAEVFGEAYLADGRVFPASLGIAGDRARYFTVCFNPPMVDAPNFWQLIYKDELQRWQPDNDPAADWVFAHFFPGKVRPVVKLSDAAIFPLTMQTFAPKDRGTRSWRMTIKPDGSELEEAR